MLPGVEDCSTLFESFQVSILHHSGPGTIYAQRVEHEVENYRIDVAMDEFFTKMEQEGVLDPTPLPSLRPGALLALRRQHRGSTWHRVKLLSVNLPLISVALIDKGGTCEAPHDSTFPLPLHLRAPKPISLRCHLFCLQPSEVVEEASESMDKHIKGADRIILRRRGAGCVLDHGDVSYPCDLSLTYTTIPDPFEPQVDNEESLIRLLRLTNFGDDGTDHPGSDELEQEEEEEEEDADKTLDESDEMDSEFSHVNPMRQDLRFKWLPPEMPSERKFGVRGTYVDPAGQVG